MMPTDATAQIAVQTPEWAFWPKLLANSHVGFVLFAIFFGFSMFSFHILFTMMKWIYFSKSILLESFLEYSLNILLPEWDCEKTQDWIFRSILLKRPNEFHYSWVDSVDSVDSVDQWTGSCAFHTLQSASSCNPRTIHTVPTLCNRRAMAVFLAAIVHRPMNRNKFIKSILFKHLTVLGCLT